MFQAGIFQKVLSYFKEIRIDAVASATGEKLEVIYGNGRLRLDSSNSNYSHGSLHRAFARCFRKLELGKRTFSNVLILGFGAGSVASILREDYNSNALIRGVESDPGVINFYKKYFKKKEDDQIEIIEGDVLSYMNSNNKIYDLVVFDVYIDRDVPAEFETIEFLSDVKSALDKENGLLVFNKYVYDAKSEGSANILLNNFRNVFRNTSSIHIREMYTNIMLIAELNDDNETIHSRNNQ